MKIVFTADLHIHAHRTESQCGGADRLGDGLSALRQTLEFARQRACPWVFGGDIKMPRRSWPLDALTGVIDVLEEFSDVEKVFVKGNHDGEGEWGSGLRAIARDDQLVESPCVVGVKGRHVAVWPAVSGEADLEKFVASAPPECRVIVGHGLIAGAKLGPDEFRADSDFTLERLGFAAGRWDVGLFGDVHKGQSYVRTARGKEGWLSFTVGRARPDGTLPVRGEGAWRGEVIYPGSPYAQNWGEREDGTKGALLVDLDTGQVDLLPVCAPRYVLEEWATWSTAERVIGESLLGERWGGNFVRVAAGAWAAERKHRELLEHLGATLSPRSFSVVVTEAASSTQRSEIHGGMPPGEMVEKYVAARPLEGIDPRHVADAGTALLGEA